MMIEEAIQQRVAGLPDYIVIKQVMIERLFVHSLKSAQGWQGPDDRRSDKSTKGAVIFANILKISGGVGAAAPPMMFEVMI